LDRRKILPHDAPPNLWEHQRTVREDVHGEVQLVQLNILLKVALTRAGIGNDHNRVSESLRITSRQNPRVKQAVALRDGSERQRCGRFVIDGAREISRAIDAGIHLVEAFICDELCQSTESKTAVLAIQNGNANVFQVSADVFAKIAFGNRHDGVLAVALRPERDLAKLSLPRNPIVTVLEGLEKPGNVGAILRSADAAGIDAVIVADGRTDLYNPNTIRASIGTVFAPNVCETTTAESIHWLRSKGVQIIAATPDAEKLYTEIDLRRGAAIVLGSEASGLSEAWRLSGITPVRLPMHGIADSLNVSTTAAVLFYEAVRQRSISSPSPLGRGTG
jgi:RNA methyltransferase, TrmH family